MQTHLSDEIKSSPLGREADAILRSCVHCGFCNATCPTYQQLGDELDGPRGRIYLIKSLLEDNPVSERTGQHLDRCLNCRACETTCPSGVHYSRLLDIGQQVLEQKLERPLLQRVKRRLLLTIIPYPRRLRLLVRMGQLFSPLLTATLKSSIPSIERNAAQPRALQATSRKMLLLSGCAQSAIKPNTNSAAVAVFAKLGIELVTAAEEGCCGAASYHLGDREPGLNFMRRNIDAWWPYIESGCEALLIAASGCGSAVKEYGLLLKDDPSYAAKAARVSSLARDPSEAMLLEDLSSLHASNGSQKPKVAFQSPCSLQHGQKITGSVETLLRRAGYVLTEVPDGHLCCGSAGTYSLLQPALSQQLLMNKLSALGSGAPDLIATANVGCHMHLEGDSAIPVRHWLELLADQANSLEE